MTKENSASLEKAAGGSLGRVRPALYVLLVIVAVLAVYLRGLRLESIYVCPADGYSADRYLSYCASNRYGDYEHGAFWFALEPEAGKSLAASQVVFLGTSRMQWAFSNTITDEWFAAASSRYYLLGFLYHETYQFEEELLHKFGARPRAYVINLDGFFKPQPSQPARYVMDDSSAWADYEVKRAMQTLHRMLCRPAPLLCGRGAAIWNRGGAIWRSRSTGAFWLDRQISKNIPVSDDPTVDATRLQQRVVIGRAFLSRLPVSTDCVILTMVPTVDTPRAEAEALAEALGMPLIAPSPAGLLTMDGSHLERESALRWSREFFDAAGPRLRRCLGS